MILFGNLFDFNGDGKLDTFEKTAEFATFASIIDAQNSSEDASELEGTELDPDNYDEF